MKIADALLGVNKLFLDTAPVIYYVEQHPNYVSVVAEIFDRIDRGDVRAVLSPVTLAECLVVPYRSGSVLLQQEFLDVLAHGDNTDLVLIDHAIGRDAAELRARYNLGLLDALQVACALNTGCEALLTNDTRLRRVIELRIVVVEDLEV
jgi:predicted nucleic acid-binding protein